MTPVGHLPPVVPGIHIVSYSPRLLHACLHRSAGCFTYHLFEFAHIMWHAVQGHIASEHFLMEFHSDTCTLSLLLTISSSILHCSRSNASTSSFLVRSTISSANIICQGASKVFSVSESIMIANRKGLMPTSTAIVNGVL